MSNETQGLLFNHICPFCVHRPTDLQRAIEVARLVAQAKGAA